MSTTDDINDTILNRIQNLLALAERTNFPEEAEAFVAKAQALMVKHTIDEAMLARSGGDAGKIVTRNVTIHAPYAGAKVILLGVIAKANTSQCISTARADDVTLVGYESDLDAIEAMFAALSIHAARTALSAPIPFGDTPRRFRRAFFLGFAGRISERLTSASAEATQEAEASTPGAGLAIIDRKTAVDGELERLYPNLKTRKVSASSQGGYLQGQAAANSAPLGRNVGGGARAALGAG